MRVGRIEWGYFSVSAPGGSEDEFGAGGCGLVEFEGVEAGALWHLVGEEVGEVEEEVLSGGLEVDVEQFGGIASEGAFLWCALV